MSIKVITPTDLLQTSYITPPYARSRASILFVWFKHLHADTRHGWTMDTILLWINWHVYAIFVRLCVTSPIFFVFFFRNWFYFLLIFLFMWLTNYLSRYRKWCRCSRSSGKKFTMVELVKFDLSHPHWCWVDIISCTSMASFKQATTGKRTTTYLHAESKGK